MNGAEIEINGIKTIIALNPHIYKTKSTGFYGNGRLKISDTEKYMINVQVVLIGSKPKTE